MNNSLKLAVSAISAAAILGSASANATVFSFDEFFIEKGATAGSRTEIFRDSFNDGVPPGSGPDDGLLGAGKTYSIRGNGFISENSGGNGRLFVDSALGDLASNPNGDARLLNRARRNRSTNPVSSAVLDQGSSWAARGILDLTILPQNPGEAFGIRIDDFSGSNPNGGNDRIVLDVARSTTTGNLGVRFSGLDFMGVPIESFDFILLQPLLDSFTSADQILLSITKDENTNIVDAEFSLFGGGFLLMSQGLDNLGNTSGQLARVFSDETFTRASITTLEIAEVPEPAGILILAGGVLVFAGLRRRRR